MAFLAESRKLTRMLAEHLAVARFDPSSPPTRDESWPRVTVVTPSFNQADYLERTIISVHNQGYPNLEHIIMDGGSNDGSVDIIRKYEKRLAHWRSEPDKGQSDAINHGASVATGRYMMWINSDDLLMPGALYGLVEGFRTHPEVDLVYANQVEIDATDKVTKRIYTSPFDIENFIYEIDIIIPQQSAMWTTELFHRVGGLRLFRYAMDYDMFYRMYESGARFWHRPGFLSAFRVYPEGLTGSGEVARGRAAEVDKAFYAFTGRERGPWDLKVRKKLFKARRLIKNPRSLIAAAEHRLGQIFS